MDNQYIIKLPGALDSDLTGKTDAERLNLLIQLMKLMNVVNPAAVEKGDNWGYLDIFMECLPYFEPSAQLEMIWAIKWLFNAMGVKSEFGPTITVNGQLDDEFRELIDIAQSWALDDIGCGNSGGEDNNSRMGQ